MNKRTRAKPQERGDAALPQMRAGPAVYWRRNLAVASVALALGSMGFGLAFPFTPLFIKELGISDPGQAAFWAGITGAAMGLGMFIFGPFWGILGDRYGRKISMLRAVFGSAIFMALNSPIQDVYQLTAVRFAMGVVTGMFAPGLAFVAATSPRERIPFAVGVLQSALFVGSTLGPLVGGVLIDAVGFRPAFLVAGATMALAGILVFALAREDFKRAAVAPSLFRHGALEGLRNLLGSREVAPIFGTMFLVQLAANLVQPVLPVLLSTIGAGPSATGVAFAILGGASALASYVTGWLAARVDMKRLLVLSCVGAALFALPFLFVSVVPLLYLFLALEGIFQGILLSSVSGLLGLAVPAEKQGAAFGAMQSVNSSAFGFAPLAGGAIANWSGLRPAFLVQTIAFLMATALIARLSRGGEGEKKGLLGSDVGKPGGGPGVRPV